MIPLSGILFLSPWVLALLAAVPVLWWLLRALPPRPKTIVFSAFFFLKGLETSQKSAAHTPWWLLLLRTLAVSLFIIAFAEPVLHPSKNLPGGNNGAVLMVIDNGWAAASHWPARQEKVKEYLRRIGRSGRMVTLLPTAPGPDGQTHAEGPMPAEKALTAVNRLRPQPWPADDVAEEIKKIKSGTTVSYTVFFSDGLAISDGLLDQVQTVVADDDTNDPYILRHGEQKNAFTLERLPGRKNATLKIIAYADDGAVADETQVSLPAGKAETEFTFDLPPDIRNRTARIAPAAQATASAVFLVGSEWRQHPVGIAATADQKETRDFLNEVYYLKRALEGGGDVTLDSIGPLLEKKLAALILPDSAALTTAEKAALEDWVRQGGFLIRFAGPHLSGATDDDLLPVRLRQGQRAMEGAMTWEKPAHLGAIARQSPLFGLDVPDDVTVTRQLLAEPRPESFEKTWLQLDDGTPLITGGKRGKGTVVLIHTTAGPDWSNFCYSGLYVETLRRMISLSSGISDYKPTATLPPLLLMDGFGQLNAPTAAVTAIDPAEPFDPSPRTPPGLYGSAYEFRAFNLGDHLMRLRPLQHLSNNIKHDTYARAGEIDLKPPLLAAAVILLILETLATLWLRGAVAFALLALMIHAAPAQAAENEADLVSGVYLGYIKTGDAAIDHASEHGLSGLGGELVTRTTIKFKGVSALDPGSDRLPLYPLIYWPMTENQPPLSPEAARNIQNYLSQGGMIVFDTRDRQFGDDRGGAAPGTRRLRLLTQDLQIPELSVIPENHILTRSFYLLDSFPGRYAGGKLWVEKEPSPRHDSVTSVVIGGNDWAAAWSKRPEDRARYIIEPGGEMQREMAYRTGINMVMAALAGSYKSDQIHIPHILERLGR